MEYQFGSLRNGPHALVFKHSKIYDPLYKKMDFCSIIRYAYISEKSGDAIFPIPQKRNQTAIVFTGFVDVSTVFCVLSKDVVMSLDINESLEEAV